MRDQPGCFVAIFEGGRNVCVEVPDDPTRDVRIWTVGRRKPRRRRWPLGTPLSSLLEEHAD